MTLERAMSDRDLDQVLLNDAVAGDVVAFEQLLLKHFSALKQHIEPQIPASARRQLATEDVLQEAFAQAFRDISRVNATSSASFYAWLKSIADHRLIDALKRIRRTKRGGGLHQLSAVAVKPGESMTTLLDVVGHDSHPPDRSAARHEAEKAIRVAVATLPPIQRDVICARFFSGKSIDDIASETGRTAAAVRGLIRRAKENLRAAMGRSSDWMSRR
jgi:RNA polymerase sigma factor (sigma-70 family)